jgi:hypothetical protein
MDIAKARTLYCIILTGFVFLCIGLASIFFHFAPHKKTAPLTRETDFGLRHRPSAKVRYLLFARMLCASLFQGYENMKQGLILMWFTSDNLHF